MSLYPTLFCDPCGKPTQHRFEIERRCETMQRGRSYEQIFGCGKCGQSRRWGLTVAAMIIRPVMGDASW
jgi:hypothetical protein